MIKKILAVLLCAGLLFGCTTKMSTVTITEKPDGTRITETTNVNNSDTAAYYNSVEAHSVADSGRVASMTESLMTPSGTDNPEARAWEGAFKATMVAYGNNFKPVSYTGEKNKTWIDVADNAVKPITSLATVGVVTGGVVKLTDKLIGAAGDTTVTQGDGGSIDGSFTSESNEASTLYGDARVENTPEVIESSATSESEEVGEEVGEVERCRSDSSCFNNDVCDMTVLDETGAGVCVDSD